MLALSSMQSTVAARIGAASFFTASPAVSCIVDDGLQDSAIETQLRTVGCVVVVPPILRAARRDLGAGKLLLEADIAVRVLVNPHVNSTPTGANRNIYAAISAAAQAVLAWTPTTVGDRRFEASEDFLALTTQDTGLLAYHLIFTKLSTLN